MWFNYKAIHYSKFHQIITDEYLIFYLAPN